MDKDKPPPVARTVEEILEDFWRRRALTEKEQRQERSPVSPVSSQASNESILNSESEDEDEDGDDEDHDGDDEYEDEDENNDGDDEEEVEYDDDDDEMDEDEEEIETKNENDDVMEEDEEEENGKAFCRACGNNDGADEFWIWCDICKKRFHRNCVKFTPALEKEQKMCPLCRAMA